MLRKLNRLIQNYLRPKRLAFGKMLWDRKKIKYSELIKDGKIDMNKINSIIFLRYDGKIGDMVVSTLLFREIKKVYPNIKIGVVTKSGAKDIIKYNKNVDRIYEFKKGKESCLARQISKENYDLLVDFNELLRVNHMKFINRCKAKINIGLDKQGWELFDISYSRDKNKHISEMYGTILKILGIECFDLLPAFELPNEKKLDVNEDYIVLNPYAASKHRTLNKENILKIGKKVLERNTKLVLIGEPSRKVELEEIVKELDNSNVTIAETKDILDVASYIEGAKKVITPDTSIVHIASAFRKPLIAIYRQDTDDTNSKVWAPNYEGAIQIFSKDIQRTGEETDINKFDIKELERYI